MFLQTRKDFEIVGNMLVTILSIAAAMMGVNLICDYYGYNTKDSIAKQLKLAFSLVRPFVII